MDEITFEAVADEARTGKMYRLLPRDSRGRPVLAMRPGRENTAAHAGQVRHLIYCMEAVARCAAAGWGDAPLGGHCSLDSEQMLLFIDFTVRVVFHDGFTPAVYLPLIMRRVPCRCGAARAGR